MADVTAYKGTILRGGFPAIGPKIGLIQAKVTIGPTMAAANDRADCFAIPAKTLILAVGFEVITATTNAVTGSLGLETAGAGSATEFSGELATNGAAGTILVGGATKANVMVSTADTLVLEISADVGAAAAQLRVFAIVADMADMEK